MLTRRRLWLFGTALLVAGWGTYAFRIATPGSYDRQGVFKGADYRHFYVLGRLALAGRGDALYDEPQHVALSRAEFEPNRTDSLGRVAYGPQVAMLFAPLARLPYGWSLVVFWAITVTVYLGCAWWTCRRLPGLRAEPGLTLLLLAANPALVVLITFGQASALALLAFTIAIDGWRRGAPVLVGVGVGLLCFKPTLALTPVLLLLLTAQWRSLMVAAAVAAAQLAAGAAYFGAAVIPAYLLNLLAIARDPGLNEPHPELLHSFKGSVTLLLGPGPLATMATLLLCAAAIAMLVRLWRSARLSFAARIAGLGLTTVLASPHLTSYDLVMLVPGFLLLAGNSAQLTPRTALLMAGVYLAPLIGPTLTPMVPVQVSVILMLLLLYRLSLGEVVKSVTFDTNAVV